MTGTIETRSRPDAWSRRRVDRWRTPLLLARLGLWSRAARRVLLPAAAGRAAGAAAAGRRPRLVGPCRAWSAPSPPRPATPTGQAHDILNSISGTIPAGMHLAGHWITPGGLIVDGLLLMALAAIGATLSALAARGM